MRRFESYPVWQLSHQLVLDVYEVTRRFPREELYGLKAQLRRASASVPTNIAEGSARWGERDFARFLDIAAGSASEVTYQLRLARDLGYITQETARALRDKSLEISRMLAGLRRHIRNRT